jgi:hypothetical protein
MTDSQSRKNTFGWRCISWWVAAVLLPCATAWAAHEVEGVQAYALDHPRVPAYLTEPGKDLPLSAHSELIDRPLFAFDCFLDTGASRLVLSKGDRDALDVKVTGATVEDWGIGGTETFDVSEPYELHVGDSDSSPFDADTFPFAMKAVLEVRRQRLDIAEALPEEMTAQGETALEGLDISFGDMLQDLMPNINVIGTPFLREHVVVLDPTPVARAYGALMGFLGAGAEGMADFDQLLNQMQQTGDDLNTFGRIRVDILPKGVSAKPTALVVPLKMAELEKEATPVTSAPVPIIEGITLAAGEQSVTADLVLDTGGAISIIGSRLARELGLDLEHPDLKTAIMGVGDEGVKALKGFRLDALTVPTTDGEGIVFKGAPVFIADIEGVQGTAGMNLFTPSVNLDMEALTGGMGGGGMNPLALLSDIRPGPMPFRRIVLDLSNARLGLDPAPVARAAPEHTEAEAPAAPETTPEPEPAPIR